MAPRALHPRVAELRESSLTSRPGSLYRSAELPTTNLTPISRSSLDVSRKRNSYDVEASLELEEPSKKGRKRIHIPIGVARGCLRLWESTRLSFDQLAKAVEDAGGPKKLCLRKKFEAITGTGPGTSRTLGALRLDDWEVRGRREEEQVAALKSEIQKQQILQGRNNDNGTETPEEFPMVSSEMQHVSHVDAGTSPLNENAALNSRSLSQSALESDYDSTSNDIWFLRDDHSSFESYKATQAYPDHVSQSSIHSSLGPELDRTLAGQIDTTSGKELLNDKKPRSPKKVLNISAVTRLLEDLNIAEPGLFTYIGKQCSATAETIASRLSFSRYSRRFSSRAFVTQGSSARSEHDPGAEDIQSSALRHQARPLRTADSEYTRFYHDLKPEHFASPSRPSLGPARQQNMCTVPSHEPTTAVEALMHAKAHSMSDEDAEAHLRSMLPGFLAAIPDYIKTADQRGVTALHLAVAYGFARVCCLILEYDADHVFHIARTNNDTSLYRFAKPAQKLAHRDLPLYHRIGLCRQWVECGKMPPVSYQLHDTEHSNQGKRGSQKRKRVLTNSTLATVSEAPVDEYCSSTEENLWKTRMPAERTTHALTPATSLASTTSAGTYPGHIREAPQYTARYTESPAPASLRRIPPNQSNITDFAQPNSSNRNSGISNAETLADGRQQLVLSQLAEDPSQQTKSSYKPPAGSNVTLPFNAALLSNAYLPSNATLSNSDSGLPVAQSATATVQPSFQQWVPNTLGADSIFPDTVALEQEAIQAFTPNFNVDFDQGQYMDLARLANQPALSSQALNYQETSPNVNQHHQHQQDTMRGQQNLGLNPALVGSASNGWSNGQPAMTMYGGVRPSWEPCAHDRPRNYNESYCRICGPLRRGVDD